MSVTSLTKSDPTEAIKTFATFRVVGDRLLPDEITQALQTVPTQAFKKGEKYRPGPEGPIVVGKTGTWFFSTDRVVSSPRLDDHVQYLLRIILPGTGETDHFGRLRSIMHKRRLEAHVTFFWHGLRGARKPTLPATALEIFNLLPAKVETDFETDNGG